MRGSPVKGSVVSVFGLPPAKSEKVKRNIAVANDRIVTRPTFLILSATLTTDVCFSCSRASRPASDLKSKELSHCCIHNEWTNDLWRLSLQSPERAPVTRSILGFSKSRL